MAQSRNLRAAWGIVMTIPRSWLKDALDRALAEPEQKPTAVAQFVQNILRLAGSRKP